jgi:hypothetical protein
MKRLLIRIVQGLLILLVVLYAADWIGWHVRTPSQLSSSVQVEKFLRTPLKGTKEEFDYMGTVAEPCALAIFPHDTQTPCWWLERHRRVWVAP